MSSGDNNPSEKEKLNPIFVMLMTWMRRGAEQGKISSFYRFSFPEKNTMIISFEKKQILISPYEETVMPEESKQPKTPSMFKMTSGKINRLIAENPGKGWFLQEQPLTEDSFINQITEILCIDQNTS